MKRCCSLLTCTTMLVQVGFQKSFGVAGMESVPERGGVWLSFVCLGVSHTLPRCGTDSILLGRLTAQSLSHLR